VSGLRYLVGALLLSPASLYAGDLKIIDAWIPAAPPGVMSHAAYLTLENGENKPKSIVSVAADGYMMAHIHGSFETDGIVSMQMIDQLKLTPGATLEMAPGGLHIMLMWPQNPLKLGETVTLTLTFDEATTMVVDAEVRDLNGGS